MKVPFLLELGQSQQYQNPGRFAAMVSMDWSGYANLKQWKIYWWKKKIAVKTKYNFHVDMQVSTKLEERKDKEVIFVLRLTDNVEQTTARTFKE